MANMEFVKGVEKLAFWGVKGTSTTTYHRMKGFDDLSKSMNPNEYARKYVDEEFERTDVTRYAPSIAFSLDQIKDDAVHDDIAKLSEDEVVGSAAVREIVIVDFTQAGTPTGTFKAVKREFSVIMDSESPVEELYKYTGNLKANGEVVKGTATSTDEWQTLTFTAEGE